MNSKAVKVVLSGAVAVLGLGFGAKDAAADSFGISVHTPGVSVGYGYRSGYGHGGYVSAYSPAPVYYPAPAYCPPAVVYAPVPVVVYPQPVYVYETRPVSRYYCDGYGRRVYYTDYVRVRVRDDHRHGHDDDGRGHDDHRGHGGDHHHGR